MTDRFPNVSRCYRLLALLGAGFVAAAAPTQALDTAKLGQARSAMGEVLAGITSEIYFR